MFGKRGIASLFIIEISVYTYEKKKLLMKVWRYKMGNQKP